MRPLDQQVFALLNAEQNVGNRRPMVFGNGGLSIDEIDAIEAALGFSTPPDFRFLLQNVRDPGGVLFPWRNFSLATYRQSVEWIIRGVLFDVEENWLWLARWGERPDQPSAREERVRGDFASWPKLLPIYGHRFLPAEPCEAGNPVFSIKQTDIIYYGGDLASYLLNEFARRHFGDERFGALCSPSRRIPIWSDFAERTPSFALDKPPEHMEQLAARLQGIFQKLGLGVKDRKDGA